MQDKNEECTKIHIKFSLLDYMLDEDPQAAAELGLCDLEDGTSLCLKCHKKFSNPAQARVHYREIHCIDRSQKNWTCPICQKSFAIKRYMANHMRITHGLSQKMYKNAYVPN